MENLKNAVSVKELMVGHTCNSIGGAFIGWQVISVECSVAQNTLIPGLNVPYAPE